MTLPDWRVVLAQAINILGLLLSILAIFFIMQGVFSGRLPMNALLMVKFALFLVMTLIISVSMLHREGQWISAVTIVLVLSSTQILLRDAVLYPAGIQRYPQPYVMFAGDPSTDIYNDLGYVGSLPEMPKPADEYRILMLGGSTVHNGHTTSSIAAYLQEQLRIDHDTVRVYNWGVVSGNASQELVAITNRAMQYAPDMIIMYNGGNDVLSPLSRDPRLGYPFNFAIYEASINMLQNPHPVNVAILTLLQVRLTDALLGDDIATYLLNAEALRAQVDYGSDTWEANVRANYVAATQTACQMGQGLGYQFVAVLQPLIYEKRALSEQEITIVEQAPFDTYRPYVERQYDSLQDDFVTLSQDSDDRCLWLDLSTIYDEDYGITHTFSDLIHVSRDGRAYTAMQIAERITTRIP